MANKHVEGVKEGRAGFLFFFFSRKISTFLNNTYPEDHIYATVSIIKKKDLIVIFFKVHYNPLTIKDERNLQETRV